MLLACSGDASKTAVEAMDYLLQEGAVPDTWAPNGSSVQSQNHSLPSAIQSQNHSMLRAVQSHSLCVFPFAVMYSSLQAQRHYVLDCAGNAHCMYHVMASAVLPSCTV